VADVPSGLSLNPPRETKKKLAVKTLPRSHDVDVHASDLVGINGITRDTIIIRKQICEVCAGRLQSMQLYGKITMLEACGESMGKS
jgi:hypothetical protein